MGVMSTLPRVSFNYVSAKYYLNWFRPTVGKVIAKNKRVDFLLRQSLYELLNTDS